MIKENILRSMLKDNENSAKPLDKFEFPMEGYLKIVQKDEKTGEIIHADEDHNTVLVWARHATFHCLTGSPFSPEGKTRLPSEGNHSITTNNDQTLISEGQYFSSGEVMKWAASTIREDYIYSYYPTKILFGTSSEYAGWDSMESNARYQATSLGYNESTFDTHIDNAKNDYSAEYSSGAFIQKRTINDYLMSKSNEAVSFDDKFIKGAIKSTISSKEEATLGDPDCKVQLDDEGYLIEQPTWRGVGAPCFIYSNREQIPETDEKGVSVGRNSAAPNYDNKLIFYFNMPSQDEENILPQNKFYPYNGYLLKEAGLFCDSQMLTYSDGEFYPAAEMPYGIVFCKRYISPFTKTGSSSVSINWVLYY